MDDYEELNDRYQWMDDYEELIDERDALIQQRARFLRCAVFLINNQHVLATAQLLEEDRALYRTFETEMRGEGIV